MKIIAIACMLFVAQSCIVQYEPLEYYVDGYTPNNDTWSTNGFYFAKSDSTVHTEWPNAIQEFYFFKDGSFLIGSNTEHIDSLDKWICKFGEKLFNYGPNGFYTIKNDTVFVEYIVTDPPGFTKALRYDFKAVKTQQGMRLFELNGKYHDQNWTFHANECVPKTHKNWLIKHRKYKINTAKR